MLTLVYWLIFDGAKLIKVWTRFDLMFLSNGEVCRDYRGNPMIKVLVRMGRGSDWQSASAANLYPIA